MENHVLPLERGVKLRTFVVSGVKCRSVLLIFFIKTELGEVKVMFKLNHLSLKMPNKQGLKKYMWNTRLSPFPSTKVQFVLIGSNLVNN